MYPRGTCFLLPYPFCFSFLLVFLFFPFPSLEVESNLHNRRGHDIDGVRVGVGFVLLLLLFAGETNLTTGFNERLHGPTPGAGDIRLVWSKGPSVLVLEYHGLFLNYNMIYAAL